MNPAALNRARPPCGSKPKIHAPFALCHQLFSCKTRRDAVSAAKDCSDSGVNALKADSSRTRAVGDSRAFLLFTLAFASSPAPAGTGCGLSLAS
eukprot:9497953-Pyramimonas_sp.AAC.1